MQLNRASFGIVQIGIAWESLLETGMLYGALKGIFTSREKLALAITKAFHQTHCLLTGNPAKVKKTNIHWKA